jgi:hypothetical protein
MKTTPSRFISLCAGLLLATATAASAQTTVPGNVTVRTAGEREFTLGGAGAANKDFDDTFGGVSFSYGWYTTETQEWVLRQAINYSNPSNGGQAWNGSTKIAFDQHLAAQGALRPFVGVNFGGFYGDRVRDTFAAGLEGGAKYYVQPRTFVFAMLEYGWFFRKGRDIDNTFSDGQFNWGVGIGFNF